MKTGSISSPPTKNTNITPQHRIHDEKLTSAKVEFRRTKPPYQEPKQKTRDDLPIQEQPTNNRQNPRFNLIDLMQKGNDQLMNRS